MGFRLANVAGRAALVDGDQYYDLETLTEGRMGSDPMAACADMAGLHAANEDIASASPTGALDAVSLGPPVPAPRLSFGIGLNYRSHAAEANMELPEKPLVFSKLPSSICGPYDDVELRAASADYEAELVVVMGTTARDIAAADAWDHVGGLMCGQDISDRVLQFASKPPHFDLGKGRDTYGPTGPLLVSTDLLADPTDLAITCHVNGEQRQSDRTSSLLFDIPTLIEYLSAIVTFSPGDLIFTGTPEGVGMVTDQMLRPGDEIVTEIEGLGAMRNRCV